MKKLINDVQNLMDEELGRANEKFPLFHSQHEGYAVILEEVEELEEELKSLKISLSKVWNCTKEDLECDNHIQYIKHKAKLLAAEAIQIGAMAQKFTNSFK